MRQKRECDDECVIHNMNERNIDKRDKRVNTLKRDSSRHRIRAIEKGDNIENVG